MRCVKLICKNIAAKNGYCCKCDPSSVKCLAEDCDKSPTRSSGYCRRHNYRIFLRCRVTDCTNSVALDLHDGICYEHTCSRDRGSLRPQSTLVCQCYDKSSPFMCVMCIECKQAVKDTGIPEVLQSIVLMCL